MPGLRYAVLIYKEDACLISSFWQSNWEEQHIYNWQGS